MSIAWTDIVAALHAWVVAGSGLPEQKVVWTGGAS